MILKEAWKERCKLRDEGYKLINEGYKLCDKGDKLCDKGDKLWKEGKKLWKEGDKLRDKGYKLYIQAVNDFFEPRAIIDWDTGEVNGTPLPIPWVELKGD